MNIAIIGSGVTGLVAGYELSKLGHSITIYEKGSKVGGLAQCIQFQGTNIESTYHHFFRRDSHLINLLKELQIEDRMLWRKGSIATYCNGELYSFSKLRDLLIFKPLNMIDKFRFGLVLIYLKFLRNWKSLKNVTAEVWLKKYCGEKVFQIIWNPLLKGKFHDESSSISMAWMWGRIHTRVNSTSKNGGKEMLGYIEGSLATLYNEIEKKLKEQNVIFKMSSNIQKISHNHNSNLVDVVVDNTLCSYDKVICTIPSNVFANIIGNNAVVSEDYLLKLRSIKYLSAICTLFSSTQSLSKYYWHNINDENAPYVVFLQHTNLIEPTIYEGKHVYYFGGYYPKNHLYIDTPDDELLNVYFDYLSRMFPDFDRSKVDEKFIFKLPNAQQVIECNYDDKIPDHATPIKNVYLYNFSQIYPEGRGINRAIREGYLAAQAVI